MNESDLTLAYVNNGTSKNLQRKPEWLRISLETSESTLQVRRDLRERKLHTVCEEARCPNLHECWGKYKTATFMILGDTCTRRCRFCSVKTGVPIAPDKLEPMKVAASVEELGINHAVITMVDRDDLPDGGAAQLAQTGRFIRTRCPGVSIEYLSSDLMGREEDIKVLVDSSPDILGHNIETVKRITPFIRSRSEYSRSLLFLKTVKNLNPEMITKSSLMLGLGEEENEVIEALKDLFSVGCNMVNMGQYLQPTLSHAPVRRYWTPLEFESLKNRAIEMGFDAVEAGPLVRSSYHAGGQLEKLLQRNANRSYTG